ncbi:hypothetical protein DY000_02040971 [Brassica cretica]|uniref:Uncharacterized protein n=1 Tax=Brassica cretica TaxID=69181 RepID=A0ABQ7BFQ4_BRACR|nr:hypothetical protein DY000_02040971 [Brassica cretica]
MRLTGCWLRNQLGRCIATERNGRSVASSDRAEWTLGRYVATELWLELGRYSDRAEHAFGRCVATLFELLSDVTCFLRRAFRKEESISKKICALENKEEHLVPSTEREPVPNPASTLHKCISPSSGNIRAPGSAVFKTPSEAQSFSIFDKKSAVQKIAPDPDLTPGRTPASGSPLGGTPVPRYEVLRVRSQRPPPSSGKKENIR